MKKRFLCVLTILCLIFTMTPLGAFANTEPVKYNLWVGGVQVTSENANDVLGDSTVKFDASNNTLYLNNANIVGTYALDNFRFGIYSEMDSVLNIDYQGTNTITVPDGNTNIANVGIYSSKEGLFFKATPYVKCVLNINVGRAYYTSGIEIINGFFRSQEGEINLHIGDSLGYASCGISVIGRISSYNTDMNISVGNAQNGGITACGIISLAEEQSILTYGDINITVGDASLASIGISKSGAHFSSSADMNITSGDVSNPDGYTGAILVEGSGISIEGTANLTSGNGGYSCALSALDGSLSNPCGRITAKSGNSTFDSNGNPQDSDAIAIGSIWNTGGSIRATAGNAPNGGKSTGLWIGESTGTLSEISSGTIIAQGNDYGIYYGGEDYGYTSSLFGSRDWYQWKHDPDDRYLASRSLRISEINSYPYIAIISAPADSYYNGKVYRFAGEDRFGTSARISEKLIDKNEGKAIVIVNGLDYPDALAAAPFAHTVNAPILMVNGKNGEIKEDVIAEINRIDPDHNANIYVIGGEGAVCPKTVDNLKALGYKNIERVAGSDRYGTAIEVAKKVNGKVAFIACGLNYPDALGGSSAACLNNGVILFTATSYLTPATKDYLIEEGIDEVVILGGTGAVSAQVEKEIKEICSKVTRLSGKNRFETSLAIANKYFPDAKDVVVATGMNFADALAGGPLAAKINAPIILVDNGSKNLPKETIEYLGFNHTQTITILGGEGAVNYGIQDKLSKLVSFNS